MITMIKKYYDEQDAIKIRARMKEKDITTQDIAEDLKFTPAYINSMIRGDLPVSRCFEQYLKSKELI